MSIEVARIPVTTDPSGAATAFSSFPIDGEILQIAYTPDAVNPLDTAASIAITGKSSGIVLASHGNLGTSAFNRVYQQPVYGTDATPALYAAAGKPLLAPVVINQELVKLVVSAGGNVKSGTFDIYYKL